MTARGQRSVAASIWLTVIGLALPVAAQTRPPCVAVQLPDAFARASEWRERIALETASLRVAGGEGAPCAEVAIERGDDADLVMEVSYLGRARRTELALEDVLAVQRPRVAGLVAYGLLRALLDAPVAPEAAARASTASAPQQRDSETGTARSPQRATRSVHVLLGGRAFLGHLPPLGRIEVLARLSARRQPKLRIAVGATGDVTRASAQQGRVIAAGLGARLGLDLRLLQRRRLRLWLGTHVEGSALLVAADRSGPGGVVRTLALGPVSADLRLSGELRMSSAVRPVIAIDTGAVLHAVRLRTGDHTLVAYAGPYIGLAIGIVFGAAAE